MVPEGRDIVLLAAAVPALRAGPGHCRQGRNGEKGLPVSFFFSP